MVECVLVLVKDLLELNRSRATAAPSGESEVAARGRLFRAFCISSLRDLAEELREELAVPNGLGLAVERAERRLIADEAIEESLAELRGELRQMREEQFLEDRRRMEGLEKLSRGFGTEKALGRKVTIQIRTLGDTCFQVCCGLDESLLRLKHSIQSFGGPPARDQKLLWARPALQWVHDLETSDSFSLFYLGITDGDSATLYYVRHCRQCKGACLCTECHGRGDFQGCELCAEVRAPCAQCLGPCRCPNCHGCPSSEIGFCHICGESADCS